jgi:hypothetical protein
MTTRTDAPRAAAITRAMALAIHAKATELANRGIPVCVDPDGAGDLTIASLLAEAAFRAASEVRA